MECTAQRMTWHEDFNRFYREHHAKVFRLVKRYRFGDAEAHDLVQESFLKAWKSRDQLQDPLAVGSWTLTIAHRTCLAELKRRKSESRYILFESQLDTGDCERVASSSVDDCEHKLQLECNLELLRSLIASHGHETRRQIAQLHYEQGMKVRDIAYRLELKENTVLSHLRRFRLVVTQALLRLSMEVQSH